jgi:glycosyltransferase involved in cell wall biosynthesis
MSKRPPVVMLVNAVHKPFDTRIFQKEALSLVSAGFLVRIIIPHTENVDRDGVQIVAVRLPRKGWEQLIWCPWLIFLKALRESRHSIFHVHDSELLVIALWLRLLGRNVVYDAHEDTPLQIAYQHWIPQWLRKPYAWFYLVLEKLAGWFFNTIIVAEPVIAKYYPERKTVLVRNFAKVETFKRLAVEKPYAARSNKMVYVGLLSKPRGLIEMLEGASLAQQVVSFTFLLGGKFAPAQLKETVLSAYAIDYMGWVEYNKLGEVLCDAKIGIIVPHPNPRYTTNYPVKLFEYMAAGLPVIASKEGETSAFVREAGCGILVDPLNTEEIAKAIIWLLQHTAEAMAMGARGQRLVFEKYNWKNEEERLLSVYNSFQ